MKAAKIFFWICAVLIGVPLLLFAELKREINSGRRQAERAVAATVQKIARLNLMTVPVEVLTNSAVGPARVSVLSTNPLQFRVDAVTAWPDWMIYEYNSQKPERGIQHYLF